MSTNSGVYQISIGRKAYIGSSVNIRKRWAAHLSDLRRGVHTNRHLQRAYTKHGGAEFNVLLYCAPDMRIEYEQRLLDGLKPEMNNTRVAKGCISDPEVIAKAAASRRKFYEDNPERRADVGDRIKAAWQAPEYREKSAARSGQLWQDPEYRKKTMAARGAAFRRFEAFGRTWSVMEAAEHFNIDRRLVWNRIQTGWTFEQAVTTPKGKRGGPRVHV